MKIDEDIGLINQFFNLKDDYYLCKSEGNIHLYNMKNNTLEIGNYPDKMIIMMLRLNENQFIWLRSEHVRIFELKI